MKSAAKQPYGFEHPQSFNKIFKRKTKMSPIEYPDLFN